jgi:hypothetical protein
MDVLVLNAEHGGRFLEGQVAQLVVMSAWSACPTGQKMMPLVSLSYLTAAMGISP